LTSKTSPNQTLATMKRSLGGRVQRFGAIRLSETVSPDTGDGQQRMVANRSLTTLD
jgi:hypothetical protein